MASSCMKSGYVRLLGLLESFLSFVFHALFAVFTSEPIFIFLGVWNNTLHTRVTITLSK